MRNLWWLVLIAASLSTFNALKFLIDLVPLFGISQELKAYVDQYLNDAGGGPEIDKVKAVIGDVAQFLVNMVNYLMFITVLAVIYLPIRYGLVLKRFRRGQPTTYWDIRSTARLTIFFALFVYLTIVYVFSELKAIDVGPRMGLNLAVAPLILLQMRRREVQEYFSQFNWEALPPAEPVASTFIPEAEPAAKEWQRVG